MKRKSYKQLSYEERVIISHLLMQGKSISEIAHQLGRNKSSISREKNRNCCRTKSYYPNVAHYKMKKRRLRRRILESNSILKESIIHRLRLTHSPEQISNALKKLKGHALVSDETIYRFIYSDVGKELRLWRYLRFNKRPYRQRRGIRKSKIKIPNRVSIHERPAAINRREVFGHWECDLMHFHRGTKSNLLVLRERFSRMLLAKLNPTKQANQITAGILELLGQLPSDARKSITFDNGSEFALHEQVKVALKVDTYFCDPYKSYQKGSVEQGNLWLREAFPRDKEMIKEEEIKMWLELINNRPLKCLNYETPREIFEKQVKQQK